MEPVLPQATVNLCSVSRRRSAAVRLRSFALRKLRLLAFAGKGEFIVQRNLALELVRVTEVSTQPSLRREELLENAIRYRMSDENVCPDESAKKQSRNNSSMMLYAGCSSGWGAVARARGQACR